MEASIGKVIGDFGEQWLIANLTVFSLVQNEVTQLLKELLGQFLRKTIP